MDLPSSESEDEQQEVSVRAEDKKETILMARVRLESLKSQILSFRTGMSVICNPKVIKWNWYHAV